MCILIQVYKVLFAIELNLIAMKLRLLALALLSASHAAPTAALAQPVAPVSSINAGSLKPVAQVEGISESVVSIRYLPMNHLHELSLSGLE